MTDTYAPGEKPGSHDENGRRFVNVLGIDPGVSGGLACIIDGKPQAFKMPETERDLFDLIKEIRSWGVDVAFLEDVQPGGLNRAKAGGEGGVPMARMGAKSAFSFGRGVGRLEMALIACEYRIERVRPQKWQQALGCKSGGDKNVTKRRAQELFPSMKITHAIADCLLIAEYGRRSLATP